MSPSKEAQFESEIGSDFLSDSMEASMEADPLILLKIKKENTVETNIGKFSCFKIVKNSDETIEDLIFEQLSELAEDSVMSSLNLLIDGKSADQHTIEFLSLIVFTAFGESNSPCRVRHPNISPILGILKSPTCYYLLHPKAPYTLENILHFSPSALKSDWHVRFLIYQILSALTYMHSIGIAHGGIHPSNILLTDSFWVWLNSNGTFNGRGHSNCLESCSSRALYADLKLSTLFDWRSDFEQWWRGELSNYEYLLVLNRLAGRRWGDHTFHTVMPWVIDFSIKPDESSDYGWRDLEKSKWRLAKGDEQLDFTFSTSEIPHHVSDECLSELAVCSYKARRLPLRVLCSAVRSVYEPNEYPSNMQRLYQWTPDECIPEFYSDPRIFLSLHSEMSDLAVPSWAASPEEFISMHRDALESEHVSRRIHHWIDITFGYKLSGQASIEAKNVMLPVSDISTPRSIGRRQLFTRPHPMRRGFTPRSQSNSFQNQGHKSICSSVGSENLLKGTGYMGDLEEATFFSEHASYLNPIYSYQEIFMENYSSLKTVENKYSNSGILESSAGASLMSPDWDLACLLEYFESDDSDSLGFHDLLSWRQKASSMGNCSEDLAGDVFSVGCILAELYLKKPLFDPVSLAAYKESGTLPIMFNELPPYVAILVEASIKRDWKRRPSAKCLTESQFFPSTVRSAYRFLAPLQLLAKTGNRLKYAAKLASEGALKSMGSYTAEMCAPYCLPLILSPLSDVEAEFALCLLKGFMKYLNSRAIKAMILPTIQKILQASEYSHLKVSLLQGSFVQELWKLVGKQEYIENFHPLVLSNLCGSPNRLSASAASVVLIGSSEELGIPITVHQTILPLIQCFGKGLCADGIDALVRIGGLLGENFIVRQLLPLLRNVVVSCVDASQLNKSEPLNSWINLALIDSLTTIDGLVSVLPVDVVLKELIEDQICLHVKVLMQAHLDLPVVQVAAIKLIALCQRIGPDFSVTYVMPQIKDLFDEMAFSQVATCELDASGRNLKIPRSNFDEHVHIESRMELVLLLYPPLASLMGIEKLRRCCSTWFLLEQTLQRLYSWKWESIGGSSKTGGLSMDVQRLMFGKIPSEYNPAKLLLNGAGWSIPQSQGAKSSLTLMNSKQANEFQQTSFSNHSLNSNLANHEPWFWFPTPDASWQGTEFLGRTRGLKDDLPWKLKGSIIYSARAHPGLLRSLAVCHDECTIFTGGVGPGFKGSVQKWELPRMSCISGYYGHDEVVNAICILSVNGRVASCDGTIHLWDGNTGKLITAYAESSANFPLQSLAKMSTDVSNMLTPNALSGGILSNAFNGSLYTCMHHLKYDNRLIAGMGNGSIRYIDVVQDRKLHLWKSDTAEYSFSSLVSAISSCGSENIKSGVASPPWIAAGLSSGHCRLLDSRSGNIVAFWRAHDGYITKLAAPEDHLLVSSSLDKTLRVWDLRRNLASQSNVYRGHPDGISSFSVWGQDVISISRNKIALTSLSRSKDEEQWLSPQKLHSVDRGMRNLSVLSTIAVLPFSRLFLVGTEDGYLKICC